MIMLSNKSGHVTYGLSEFLIESATDISNLPVDVPIGSSALDMSTGDIYFLRHDGDTLDWLKMGGDD